MGNHTVATGQSLTPAIGPGNQAGDVYSPGLGKSTYLTRENGPVGQRVAEPPVPPGQIGSQPRVFHAGAPGPAPTLRPPIETPGSLLEGGFLIFLVALIICITTQLESDPGDRSNPLNTFFPMIVRWAATRMRSSMSVDSQEHRREKTLAPLRRMLITERDVVDWRAGNVRE